MRYVMKIDLNSITMKTFAMNINSFHSLRASGSAERRATRRGVCNQHVIAGRDHILALPPISRTPFLSLERGKMKSVGR